MADEKELTEKEALPVKAKEKKKKPAYGKLFRFLRWLLAPFYHRYSFEKETDSPVLYLCRHQNMKGPVRTLTALSFAARPLVLSVFFTYRDCIRQYRDYTFSVRGGMPKWLATLMAAGASLGVVPIVRSLRAIPVYRESTMRSTQTIKETLSVLEDGYSSVIYADMDYVGSSEGDHRVYRGFLLICRQYERRTGRPLPIVVLNVRDEDRSVTAHAPLFLTEERDETKREAEERILSEVTRRLFDEE